MKPVQIQDDLVPIGEFKTHASRYLRRLRRDRRPIIITQRGKASGVLLTPEEYDRLMARELFVKSVEQGLTQSRAGMGRLSSGDLNDLLDESYGQLEDL